MTKCYKDECPGELELIRAKDGSCYVKEKCGTCGCHWFFDPPIVIDDGVLYAEERAAHEVTKAKLRGLVKAVKRGRGRTFAQKARMCDDPNCADCNWSRDVYQALTAAEADDA